MLTAERLRELLDYDPLTGVFLWKVSRGKRSAGSVAGSVRVGGKRAGYRELMIDKKSYQEHRVAWLYVYGEWPADEIDHKDLCRSNNVIANLREATRSQNSMNCRLRPQNSGWKGVTRLPSGRWQAYVQIRGKRTGLGTFSDPEEAHRTYQKAAAKEYGEYARFE